MGFFCYKNMVEKILIYKNKKILFKQLKKNPTKEGINNILKNTFRYSKIG